MECAGFRKDHAVSPEADSLLLKAEQFLEMLHFTFTDWETILRELYVISQDVPL